MPWSEWYEDKQIVDWHYKVRHLFPALKQGMAFHDEICPNMTMLTNEKYQYYIRDFYKNKVQPGELFIISIGALHKENVQWLNYQLQVVFDEYDLQEEM